MKSYEEILLYLTDYKDSIDKVKDLGLSCYESYRDHYIGRCEAVSEVYDKTVMSVAMDVEDALTDRRSGR